MKRQGGKEEGRTIALYYLKKDQVKWISKPSSYMVTNNQPKYTHINWLRSCPSLYFSTVLPHDYNDSSTKIGYMTGVLIRPTKLLQKIQIEIQPELCAYLISTG